MISKKGEHKHAHEISIVRELTCADSFGELDAIACNIEDQNAGPFVGISLRIFGWEAKLHQNGQNPDRDQAESYEIIRGHRSVNYVHDQFFRHAPNSIEKQVAEQTSLKLGEVEIVDKDFD